MVQPQDLTRGYIGAATDTAPVTANSAGGARQAQSIIDTSVTPTDGDVPTWNAAAGKYQPSAPSGGGSGVLVSDPITLSSAELLDLHNTPIALLPAPTGDGQSLWLIGYSTLYTPGPGPVAYTAGADAEIDFVVGDELVANFAPGAAGMTDTVPYRLRQPLAVQGRQNPQVNQPLTLSAFASDGAALLNGDGTLTIRVVAAFV